MGDQKEEDLYHNFSRKDLQGLCKKYGLPANKSNSEMATSLILYLEKKNLCSRATWEGTRKDFFTSEMRELQAGVEMNSIDDQRKDCRVIASRRGSGNRRPNNHRDAQQNNLLKCKGSASFDKASEDVGNLTQLYRESNSGAGIQENTFSSVVSSSAMIPSPTFTYNVFCEDGIQLYVDLNSSPSYWIENLKAGVHICHHVHNPISQSFHQDIGLLSCSKEKHDSVIMDPSKEADNGQLEAGSYPTNVLADIQAQTDEPDGLKFLSHAFSSLDNSKEEQPILSPDPKCSGFPGQPGASTSYDLYENPSLQQTNASLNAVPKGSELSTTVCKDMQTSTCATLSQAFEPSPSGINRFVDLAEQKNNEVVKSVQNQPLQAVDLSKSVSCSPSKDNHSLEDTGFPRTLEAGRGGTDEEQKKDSVLHSCSNGGPFDLVVPKQNGGDVFNSVEFEKISRFSSAADVGNLGIRNPSNGSEESKSLNFKDQLGIPRERPASSESNGELKKKRHNGIESQSKFVNAEAKILRSSKQFVGDIHSKRRRSSRLFTK